MSGYGCTVSYSFDSKKKIIFHDPLLCTTSKDIVYVPIYFIEKSKRNGKLPHTRNQITELSSTLRPNQVLGSIQ